MQYEIFYNIIYPSIKASLEAMNVYTKDEYEPATDFDGLDKFTILPISIFGSKKTLLELDDHIEKLLKEYNISYTKGVMDFRIPYWYKYAVILD